MAAYYMTYKHHSAITHWEPCNAQTLRGAKRECTGEYSGQLTQCTLEVGAPNAYDPYTGLPHIVTVSRKGNDAGDRWIDDEQYA